MITETAEKLLNRNLPASPRAREMCAALEGKRVALTVEGPGLRWILGSTGSALKLERTSDTSEPVDAEIHGTPVNLLGLLGRGSADILRRGDVRITGDAEVAQRFRELGHLLRPDLEEELSRLVGDGTAHRVGRLAAGAMDYGRKLVDTGARNMAEFLAHERRDLVPRAEAEAFHAGVDRVREAVDRLEARIRQLDERKKVGQ